MKGFKAEKVDLGKKIKKYGKVFTTGMTAMAMAVQLMAAAPVFAAEKQTFTESQIRQNNGVLYTVNCGAADASVVPEGATKGLYQSRMEQGYGEDPVTGLKWGYLPDDDYTKRKSGTIDGNSTLTGSYIYVDNTISFSSEKTGFDYRFELPERADHDYAVTVGALLPGWEARSYRIQLEGEEKGSLALTGGSAEATYEVEVTDGELNVFIHNPDAGDARSADPLVSYIIVKAVYRIPEVNGGSNTYYVDSANGNDDNNGLTPETAWQTLSKASAVKNLTAGGKILLKSGSVWDGQKLTVKGAKGTKENPVVIGSYGTGEKPQINGKGAGWEYNTKEELAAVHIYNSENIIVENLDITNWDASAGKEYKQSWKLLSGLVVENRDGGKLSNVVIRNNKIHDVNGLMRGGAEKAAGGLIVVVTGNGEDHTGLVESWYDGLTISGNEVTNVCHEAIYMESVWAARKLVGGTNKDTSHQNAGNSPWVGSSKVKIDNNYVYDVAGDGIVPINTTDALVEYNLIHNSADSRWDYSPNPAHAALWAWDADNVIFRYNEACHTSWKSYGTYMVDSMAFDFDYGLQNCVYEYNYSHDNQGGFMMLCPGPGATANNIARYNISVNDGHYDGVPLIRMGAGNYGSLGVQIYNNSVYWSGTEYTPSLMPSSPWEGSEIKDVEVFNNIFSGPVKENSVTTEGISYHDNIAFRGAEKAYQPVDANAIVADPKFKDVKNYTEGTWKDGKTTLGTAKGFQIAEDSPCVDKGVAHPEAPSSSLEALTAELVANTTKKLEKDYFGNPLNDGKVDIGAHEWTNVNKVVKVSKITIQAPSKKLVAGKTIKLTADVKPAKATNKKLKWKVNKTKYASINSKTGSLKLKSAGAGKTVTVTAQATDGSGRKATCKISIMKNAVKSITIKAPSKSLKVNKTMKLKATVKTTGSKVNKTLTWKSSNTKYATVDKNGKVKAKKAGKGKTVTITAMAVDGSGKKATVKIKIKK